MLLALFWLGIPFVILLLVWQPKDGPFCAPPGPKGLPFIGNLHQFNFHAPHIYLAKLAKVYGAIITLRLGCRNVVVVQSAKTAKEVLKTQDVNFCSRPLMVGTHKLSYNGLDIAFCPYNEYFREVKKISVVHLLSSKRVQSYAPIRQEEISRLLKRISSLSCASEIINLSELLMSFSCTIICRMAFGKGYDNDEGSRSRFHSLLNEAEASFISFYFSDYFPSIGWLDKLTGRSSKLEKTFMEMDMFYEEVISDHLDPYRHKPDQEDIIDVLLHLQQERSFAFELTLDHIKAVLMNIFVAGIDTTTIMVVWAMTELIKNPDAMRKVQDELRNATTNKGYIVEDDLQNLNFFTAVVKETFRLHPAGPMLIAHETIQKTKIEGYDILPKTLVYVNAWAIARDPESWKNPEKFMPERFLGSSIDFKGQDFELLPFGAGRRMCPGLHHAVANVELTLANLLHSFDWELPVGERKEDIDTDTIPGIAMHKKNPLRLVARKFPRLV